MCLGRIKKKKKDKIISTLVRLRYLRTISGWKKIWALVFERSSRLEEGSLENLGESAAIAGACTSRKVQAMEEAAVEGRQGWEGIEQEEMRGSQTLSRKECAKRSRSGETETDGIRAPGVCTLFRVSARAGNMTAVTSAWIFEGGETSKEHVLRALGRRLNNAKSTYSPAVPSFFFSLASPFSSLYVFQPAFLPFLRSSPLCFSFSRSRATSLSIVPSHFSRREDRFNPPVLSLLPLALSIRFYSVTYRIIALYFVSYVRWERSPTEEL